MTQRSSFAKLSDKFRIVEVPVEKIVRRRDVEPLRPVPVTNEAAIKEASEGGRFLEAIRRLADFESCATHFEDAMASRSLKKTIEALRDFEREYHHTRRCIQSLPRCAERDCMHAIVEKYDVKSKQAWKWVGDQAERFDGPHLSSLMRQQRRRNKRR